MENEVWKNVPGFPGYQVSDRGRVRSGRLRGKGRYGWSNEWRILGGYLDGTGRPTVAPYRNKVRFTRRIHRLVLEAFVGPRPEGALCCHNNGNKTDNRLSNLRWDTPESNVRDAIRHGSWKHKKNRKPRAATVNGPKLNRCKVQIMRTLHRMAYHYSDIASIFNVSNRHAWDVVHNRLWKCV